MSIFNIKIAASADVTKAVTQMRMLEASADSLAASMQQAALASTGVNPTGYAQATRAMKMNSQVARDAAQSTGMWAAEQLKLNTAADDYNKKLAARKLSLSDIRRESKVAQAAYREQLALQQMVVRSAGKVGGKELFDVYTPTQLNKQLDTAAMRFGFLREQIASASHQMVNWGKNTQWAGRQLMVGLTMPVAAFGAAAGVMAYQVDNELTRIQKVYDTTAQAVAGNAESMAAVDKELAQVRVESLRTAATAAREYAASGQETLQVQADLAAIGLKGVELQKQTNEVMRIATLGELDRQTSTEMAISLQNVFRMSNEELSNSFNYLNAIENATSLSTKDFAEAIPIAAGPIKAFGGDIQELGVLLTAMRERGIAATQGANAIKAAMQRLGRPSKQIREEFAALTGGDIVKLVDESNSLSEIFTKLYHITEDLSAADQRKVFAGLFGSYQVTRMMALTQGMGDLEQGIGQVSTAAQVAGKSTTEWAETAQMEIDRMMQSPAKQFKAQLEELKLNMAQMGEPFLVIAATIMKGINAILKAFNGLPKGVKILAGLTIGLLALAGPVIMLVGLFANLAGNFGKFFVMLTKGAVNFGLLNKETAANRIASNMAERGFINTGTAVQDLTNKLNRLVVAYETANGVSARSLGQVAAPVNIGAHGPAPAGAPPIVAGGITSNKTGGQLLDRTGQPITTTMVADTEKISRNSDNIKKSWGMTGKMMGAASAAMMVGAVSSNETASNFANIAATGLGITSMLSMFGLAMPKIKSLTGTTGGAWKVVGAAIKGAAGWVWKIVKFIPMIVRGIHPLGWALAAVLGAWKLVSNAQDSAAQDQKKLNNSASAWAEHLGYSKTEWGKIGRITKNVSADVQSIYEKAALLRATNPEIVEGYQEMADEAGKAAFAEQQYLTMLQTGASKEQALEGIRHLFIASGDSIQKANEKLIKFRDNTLGLHRLSRSEKALRNLRSEMEKIGKTKWMQADASDMGPDRFQYKRLWKDPLRFIDSIFRDEEKEAYEAGTNMARQVEEGLSSIKNPFEKGQFLRTVSAQFNRQWKQIISMVERDTMSSLSRAGINTSDVEEMKKVITDAGNMGYQEFMDKYNATYNDWMRLSTLADGKAKELAAREKGLTDNIKSRTNAISQSNSVSGLLADNQGKILGATKEQAKEQLKAAMHGRRMLEWHKGTLTASGNLTREQKLQVLNTERQRYGLAKTLNLADGFGPATKKWKDEQKGVNNELGESDRKLSSAARRMKQFKELQSQINAGLPNAVKDAFAQLQQEQADATMEDFERRQERAMEHVEASAEAQMEKFEKAAENSTERMENRHDKAMKHLERSQENSTERMERRHERATNAMEARAERATAALEREQEQRRRRIEQGFDRRINRIQNVIEAEQRAEETRKRIFDAEMQRLDRLNESANRNIDFNVAINTGNLDEAAKIRNDMESQASAWALGDASDAQTRRFERRQERLQGRIENIETDRDKRLEAIERVEEAEKKSLDRRLNRERKILERRQEMEKKFRERQHERERNQLQRRQEMEKEFRQEQIERDREALQKNLDRTRKVEERKWESRRKYLEKSLDDFTGYIARSDKDLKRHIKIWEKEHKKLSLTTKGRFDRTSDAINAYIKTSVTKAGKQIVNEANWELNGWRIAKKMIKGAFGMSPKEFRKFIGGGNPPKGYGDRPVDKPDGLGGRRTPRRNRGRGPTTPYRRGRSPRGAFSELRHTGGEVGGMGGSRKGYARNMPQHRNEVPVLAEKGEYIVNKKSAKKYGGLLKKVNMDGFKRNEKLPMGGSGMDAGANFGMASMFGMMMAAALRRATEYSIQKSGDKATRRYQNSMLGALTMAKAGKYGDSFFSQEQLRNAATIANIGKQMNMSRRDIVIGLMTAMQESGLINRPDGDRDSAGLFQQRPSQGWGSWRQVTNPDYSARKFFNALKGVKNRDSMPKTLAAQAVQRSAYPYYYAKWQDEAEAIMRAMKPSGIGAGFVQGTGRRTHPTKGRGVEGSRLHGSPPALDISLPVGNGIYAVRSGVVSASRDIRGFEPRARHGGNGFKSYGRYITINHDGGGSTLYAHLKNRLVRKGQRVQAGARIGVSGDTGYSTGPHLHFGSSGAHPGSFLSLQKGAANIKWDNTIANLHKGEAVLTKDLNEKFHQGVERFANGGETIYNLNMNFGGVSDKDEIARHVIQTIKRAEARKPRSRR